MRCNRLILRCLRLQGVGSQNSDYGTKIRALWDMVIVRALSLSMNAERTGGFLGVQSTGGGEGVQRYGVGLSWGGGKTP